MIKPPDKRFKIDLEIQAHTWKRAIGELWHLMMHIEEHGECCQSVGGLHSGSHVVNITEDPTMTEERYEDELHQWSMARKAAARADGDGE